MEFFKTWGWLLALVALAMAAVAVWWLMQRSAPVVHSSKQRAFRMEDWPPRTMRPLTPGELRTFVFLRRALPECLLLPQIALARFLSVNQNRSYNQWFGSVGRRCVDFLVCSEQGDVLGVIQLSSGKGKSISEGTQRKMKALEMAQIPIWPLNINDLPDAKALRAIVMPELQAAEQHSHMLSVQHAESEWQATQFEARRPASAFEPSAQKPASAATPGKTRWDQAWPTEEARSSEFLDEFGMIELPPLVAKGSGRSATGFTRG
jgi:Protein of unknown function (DUF2726)